MNTGRNWWVSTESNNYVKSEKRPEPISEYDYYIPSTPKNRIKGASYTPYMGNSNWEMVANWYMSKITRAYYERQTGV